MGLGGRNHIGLEAFLHLYSNQKTFSPYEINLIRIFLLQLIKLSKKMLTHGIDIFQEAVFKKLAHNRKSACTCQGISTEGAAVISRNKKFYCSVTGYDRPDRETGSESLGRRTDIRRYTVSLISKKAA